MTFPENPNQSVILKEKEPYLLKWRNEIIYEGKINIILEFLPTPRLRFVDKYCKLSFIEPYRYGEEYELSSPQLTFSVDVIIVEANKNKYVFMPLHDGIDNILQKNVILHGQAFIVNFACSLNRILIENEESTVEIIKRNDFYSFTENKLKKTGGFGITHHVYFKMKKPISIHGFNKNIYKLYQFISFINGAWCGLLGVTTFDDEEKVVHEKWGCQTTDAWGETRLSFFSDNESMLPGIYDGFIKLISHSEYGQDVNNVVYWYLYSNTKKVNVDGSIMLTYAALELLTWIFLVKQKGISRSKYKNSSFSQNLIDVLNLMGIPASIPESCPNLQTFSYNLDVSDDNSGVEILKTIRNDLVHPYKYNEYKSLVYFEAWNLGQWYIEMILLKMMNYNGNYSNRLALGRWKGEVENVPWI